MHVTLSQFNIRSFFVLQSVNWDLLAEKKISAPFKPQIRDELDVSNFAEEFTDMVPTYSPAAVPKTADRIFKVSKNITVSNLRYPMRQSSKMTTILS